MVYFVTAEQDKGTTLIVPSTSVTLDTSNISRGNNKGMCSQQCSEQYLSYCTGYKYPLEENLELSILCHNENLQGRDRQVTQYIDSANNGQWNNMTAVFQDLLAVISPSNETFPEQYFSPTTSILNVLNGHKMSPMCNASYTPLKELVCSWLYVSPCHPDFRVCPDSCNSLIDECFPSFSRGSESRTVVDFICHALTRNAEDNCYLPEDVYREEGLSRRKEKDKDALTITIISASVGSTVLLFVIVVVFALRHFLYSNGYVSSDISIKMNLIGAREIRDRAREIIRNKTDIFPQVGSSERSLADRSICSLNSTSFKKRSNNLSVYNKSSNKKPYDSQQSLDQFDNYSLNSSASTFYCQTNQSVSTIGEILPPEAITFEGILSSRWKSTEDEVIALVSWIDGIGNKRKGVIKCYTDKKRKLMEDELNVISHLNHDNVCEYFWRSMGNRPHIRGMSPQIQSLMSVRNNYFCTEYYNFGSLKDFLIANGHFLKDTAAQSFLKDIACGMTYLHELEVFHRDLKTANILVGNKPAGGIKSGSSYPFRLVISDFGHSQEKDRQDCFVRDGSGGTSQYTAPEVLLSDGSERIDLYKADVYSMALVLWEIISYICCKHNENTSTARLDVHVRQVILQLFYRILILYSFPVTKPTKFILRF